MSAHQLIHTLEKLLALHQSLHHLSNQKTDVLKKGNIDSLKEIIKDEQKHLLAIQKVDKERELEVYKLISGHEMAGEHPSISDCIRIVTGAEKEKLSHIQEQLTTCLTQIKEANELNQQLLHQSLQFINLSLEMVSPEPQEINYGRPSQKQATSTKIRFQAFDSKA